MVTAVPSRSEPVRLWRRFAAMAYDLLPLVGLWILGAAVWAVVFHRVYDLAHPGFWPHALLEIWLLAIAGTYFVASWVRVGATIGMRAWRFRLVRSDGVRVDARLGALRFLLALVSLVALGCGFWYAWLDPARRTWHDRVCGTRVVRY